MANKTNPVVEEARSLFASAKLPFPIIPEEWLANLKEIGPWAYSTRPLPYSPYDIFSYVQEALEQRAEDYVVLAHAGHGINSYAIHVYVSHGPLALFLQMAWGGVYTDNDTAATRMGDIFAVTEQLIAEVRDAQESGRLKPGNRMLIVESDFSGALWSWLDHPADSPDQELIWKSRVDAWEEAPVILQEALKAVQAL
jgi:hypothetical protein